MKNREFTSFKAPSTSILTNFKAGKSIVKKSLEDGDVKEGMEEINKV